MGGTNCNANRLGDLKRGYEKSARKQEEDVGIYNSRRKVTAEVTRTCILFLQVLGRHPAEAKTFRENYGPVVKYLTSGQRRALERTWNKAAIMDRQNSGL